METQVGTQSKMGFSATNQQGDEDSRREFPDSIYFNQKQQKNNSYLHTSSSSSTSITAGNLMSKDGGSYDLGELDQALFLYLDAQDPSGLQDNSGMRPPTLNIFPSEPMHLVHPSTKASHGADDFKRLSDAAPPLAASGPHKHHQSKPVRARKGQTSSSDQEAPKTPDPKTLRRLAQNREAARKSRLRKKAYVQQLESSRIRLTQLEQELQRARAQGVIFGGDLGLQHAVNGLSSDAMMFDMEYGRWLEEHHRMMCELRAAVEERLPDNELRLFVDNCLAHFDEMINLKSIVAKSDVFHIVSGIWKTPAERCFMWIGGFRPTDVLKIVMNQIEPLSEQQVLEICGLQQSTQEGEDSLSQGLDTLNQSLSDTIASDSLICPPNYMAQMAIAMNKLSTLEPFLQQAENLRQQTVHRLLQVLTTRQAARSLLTMAEYFHRLRALSSLWLARSRCD